MSVALTLEQSEFKHAFRRFLSEEITSEYLRKRCAESGSCDFKLRAKIGELGLLSYFNSSAGSEGVAFLDLALIAEEAGRALLPDAIVDGIFAGPYSFSYLLGGAALAQAAKLVPKNFLDDQSLINAPFGIISAGASSLSKLTLSDDNAATYLTGHLRLIPLLDVLNHALVLLGDVSNPKIVFVDVKSAREKGLLKCTAEQALDETVKRFQAEVMRVPCAPISDNGGCFTDCQLILKSSELAGMSERVVEMTVQYVSQRKQFDVPVGGFQAVQHGLAEMHLQAEALSSLSRFAAWSVDSAKDQRMIAARAAIHYGCEVAPLIVERAIQLHGGIGFTWEFDLHLFLRRVKSIAAEYSPTENSADEILDLLRNS